MSRRLVLLVQLPIPPSGPAEPVRGNVPLAAGCLKLFARRQGLETAYAIELFPPQLANTLGDQGLVEAILARRPWLVGFTCYVWNVDRTLWIAQRLKEREAGVQIVLGGPEITADNTRALGHPAVDYAAIGEGEATFAALLCALRSHAAPPAPIDGLWTRGGGPIRARAPLPDLNDVASPYLEGVLEARDEQTVYLETARGCAFRCKFCYYPKGVAGLRFLSLDRLAAVLRYAAGRGVEEVVLLDPTLNHRRDFARFARVLAAGNPGQRFSYFGELRAEGIRSPEARRLADANFTEVEVGLQAVDARVQRLMGRTGNQAAFERGARALLDAGIRVKVDLILGLPGDTTDSVRRSIDYLRGSGLYSSVQVFYLSVLPGTVFRRDAARLGLAFQSMPPYHVFRTPTLEPDALVALMQEAEEAFHTRFDPPPTPVVEFRPPGADPIDHCRVDLDGRGHRLAPANRRAQAFTLWLRSTDFHAHREAAAALVRRLLDDNPHTTLQVVLQPTGPVERVTPQALGRLLETCYRTTSYLDHFYSTQPGAQHGAKRLVVMAPAHDRARLARTWLRKVGGLAAVVWSDRSDSAARGRACLPARIW